MCGEILGDGWRAHRAGVTPGQRYGGGKGACREGKRAFTLALERDKEGYGDNNEDAVILEVVMARC